tara:strand:+ start:19153 stop:20877 length:1725 start_codon:yes stop_codon:yes gene_type:complete
VAINQDFRQIEFFKQTPRDVSKDVIDWSDITGKFVEFIQLERDRRGDAKAEIDKNVASAIGSMDDLETGMDVEFNNFMFNSANNLRQYLLTQEKLLKSNQISVSEFNKRLANTNSSLKNFKDYMNTYNGAIQNREFIRRGFDQDGNKIDGPGLSSADDWLMMSTGKYMDFGDTEYVVSKDGVGGIVMLSEDLTAPYDISTIQSMGNLNNMSQQMFMAYDPFGDIKSFVDEIGTSTQGNYYYNVKSEKFNPEYDNAKNGYIGAIINSDDNLISLVSDYIPGYDPMEKMTYDQSKRGDENFLVMTLESGRVVPDRSSAGWKKATKDAENFLSTQIDVQTKEEATRNRYTPDPERRDKKDLTELYRQMEIAYSTGDQGAIQLAAQTAGFEIGLDNTSGVPTGTIQGQPYPLDTPQGYRQWLLAAGQAASKNLSLAGERFDAGDFGNAQITTNVVNILGVPPEKDGNTYPSGIEGPYIVPDGESPVAVSNFSNPSALGYQLKYNRNDSEASRKAVISRAYEGLAEQLNGTLDVDLVGGNWTVIIDGKDVIKTFSRTFQDNIDDLDDKILKDYNILVND